MMIDKTNEARWVEAAVAGELEKLAHLPVGENIHRPGSTFFSCLLKLAAVVKGTGADHMTAAEALQKILETCQRYGWLKEKEIRRQWGNAYKLANPRFKQPPSDAGSR